MEAVYNGLTPNDGATVANDEPAAAPPTVALAGGTAVTLGQVNEKLGNLPDYILNPLEKNNVKWEITNTQVGDWDKFAKLPNANNIVPGWLSAAGIKLTYDNLPDVYDPADRAVVISSNPAYPQGSYDVVYHETGHAFDAVMGNLSQKQAFVDAYNADHADLTAYYNQPGNLKASLQETFAEGFARYYADDPTFGDGAGQNSHLYTYFNNLDAKLSAPPQKPGH